MVTLSLLTLFYKLRNSNLKKPFLQGNPIALTIKYEFAFIL